MNKGSWFLLFLLVAGLLGRLVSPNFLDRETGTLLRSNKLSSPLNLLPNASFELPFGEEPRQPTNWADILNPLTINLAATDQQPKEWPPRRLLAEAVEGRYVAQVTLDEKEGIAQGHLTSPVIPVKGGQVYTLSAYVKGDSNPASLMLCFWTRPLDWSQIKADKSLTYLSFEGPDARSLAMPLSNQWKRYQFSFVTEHLVSQGVVDLMITGKNLGKVWVDAVQIEEGPTVSKFQTRHPIESVLAGRQKPPMVHLVTQPLKLFLATYNSHDQNRNTSVHLKIKTMKGISVLKKKIQLDLRPGYQEQELIYDFNRVGEFIARIDTGEGNQITLEDYMFVVHPVMDRDLQGIKYSEKGNLKDLPAQRVWIPWTDSDNFFADPPPNLTVTKSGVIYAALKGDAVAVTKDGGRNWNMMKSKKTLMSVLPDETFLSSTFSNGYLTLYSSQNRGVDWTKKGQIQVESPQPGPITQLKNKTLVWPIGHPRPGVPHTVYLYRSQDGGSTWSEGYPACPGGEPALIQLNSGRLILVARHNPSRSLGEWRKFYRNEFPWLLWQRATSYYDHHRNRLRSYEKNLLMVNSDDGGITWEYPRAVTHLLDEMHGSAVELPDGRIVLFYVHRLPSYHGGERAKVSRDGGMTWDEKLYYLNTVGASNWEEVLSVIRDADGGVFTFEESSKRSYDVTDGKTLKALWYINDNLNMPGYSASCVLPPELADGKPGMILTIVGVRKGKDYPAGIQAIRWRPLK